jgi:hypothetical protein
MRDSQFSLHLMPSSRQSRPSAIDGPATGGVCLLPTCVHCRNWTGSSPRRSRSLSWSRLPHSCFRQFALVAVPGRRHGQLPAWQSLPRQRHLPPLPVQPELRPSGPSHRHRSSVWRQAPRAPARVSCPRSPAPLRVHRLGRPE